MQKITRIALKIFLIAGLLFSLGILAVYLLVDPNDYKETINTQLGKHSPRPIEIQGDIRLQFFPNIGIAIDSIQVGNTENLQFPPLATIDTIQVSLEVIPLLQKQVKVSGILLDGLQLNLSTDVAGLSNFSDLLASSDKQQVDQTSSSPLVLPEINIANLGFRNTNIFVNNEATESYLAVKDFNLDIENFSLANPFTFIASLKVALNKREDEDYQIKLEAETSIDLQQQIYSLKDFLITADSDQLDARLSIRSQVNANLTSGTVTAQSIEVSFSDIKINGDFKAEKITTLPTWQAHFELKEFSPRDLLKQFGIQAPKNPQALKSLHAKWSVVADDRSIRLDPFTLSMDKTKIDATLSIPTLAKSAITYQIKLDSINLDTYIDSSEEETMSSSSAEAPVENMDTNLFRLPRTQGNIAIDDLVMMGTKVTQFSTRIKTNQHGIEIKPIQAKLMEGSSHGDISIDARGDSPQLAVALTFNDIQIEQLQKALLDDASIEGKGNLKLAINIDLGKGDNMISTLNGKIETQLNDGAIMGVNLSKLIRQAASLVGKPIAEDPTKDDSNRTDFSEMNLSCNINQGIAQIETMDMRSPLLRVDGNGSINLINSTLDMGIKPVLVSSLKGQGGKSLNDLTGIPIPIRLTGDIANPKTRIDSKALLKVLQKKAVKDKGNELLQGLLGGNKKDDEKDDKASKKSSDKDAGNDLLKGLLDGLSKPDDDSDQ